MDEGQGVEGLEPSRSSGLRETNKKTPTNLRVYGWWLNRSRGHLKKRKSYLKAQGKIDLQTGSGFHYV